MAPPCLYQYSPLTQPDAIRLLDIKPGSGGDTVCVSLRVVTLAEKPDYEALSYVWGVAHVTEGIFCDDLPLRVTTNLHDALRQLRRADRPRTLWADALCINQADLDEKTQQVQVMHRIYQSCRRTVVWLGTASTDSGVALEMVNLMAGLVSEKLGIAQDALDQHLEAIEKMDFRQATEIGWSPRLPPKESPKWLALFALLGRPWFTRVWVIQEAFFAPDLLFYCGPWTCRYAALYYAANWVLWNGNAVRHAHQAAAIERHFAVRANVMRLRPDEHTRRFQRLTDMLTGFEAFEATDARDHVYALMHLPAFQREYPDLVPDYRRPAEAVYIEVAFELLRRSRDLLLLAKVDQHAVAPATTLQLPSWVPRWHAVGTGHHTAHAYHLMAASGASEKARKRYAVRLLPSAQPTSYAAQEKTPLSPLGPCPVRSPSPSRVALPRAVLGITGFRVDVVHDVCELEFWGRRHTGAPLVPLFRPRTGVWARYRPQKADGTLPPSPPSLPAMPPPPWPPSGEACPYATEPSVVAAYAMTLTGSCRADDRGVLTHRCDAAEAADHLADFVAFLTWARTLRRENDDSGADDDETAVVVVPEPLPPGDFYPPGLYAPERPTLTDTGVTEVTAMAHRYSAMACSANFGRCLYRTQRGFLGSGPEDVRRGDLVVILMGGAVPFVLRPAGPGYVLVGDAYVHGVMDGELVRDWEEGRADLGMEEFHIH